MQKKKTQSKLCSYSVKDTNGVIHTCSKLATTEINGKPFCQFHIKYQGIKTSKTYFTVDEISRILNE